MIELTGVMAGTRVDTAFGVEFLKHKGISSIGRALSESPQEQTALQALDRERLTGLVIRESASLIKDGADSILIYCNSLSGSVNLAAVRQSLPVKVLTPFDVYERVASKYIRFGLIAANCQSCANIEKFILRVNRSATVLGVGNLAIVNDIEEGKFPDQLMRDHSIAETCLLLHRSGCEIIILGCTHFTYFHEELKKILAVPVFEPSEELARLLIRS